VETGTESLTELISTIVTRVGDDVDVNHLPHIMYEDDEGDRVLLGSDSDLIAAVNCARIAGWKGLKLFLDYSHVQKKSYPTTLAKPAKAPPRSEPVHYEHFDKESSWLSNPVYVQTAVVAATVVVVGITLGYVLRRSN
jgi:arabinogalactan endo-1,4-beta-galactosidase